MTFREAVKQSCKCLIKARGKSFKTTKKEIWKAVEQSDWDKELDDNNDDDCRIFSRAFHWNGVHLYVFCWDEGTVLVVNLTPSY